MKNNAEKSRKVEKSRTKTPCHVVYALWGKSVPPGNRSRHGTITEAKTRLTSKKSEKNTKNMAQKRVCRERYYMKEEELLSKDSSKDVLMAKIKLFMEGRKTEYTSRDRKKAHSSEKFAYSLK